MTTGTMTMNLTDRAMLARLSITQWSAKKHDKRVTEEVRQQHHAANDAGRYNKSLISAEAMKTVQQAASTAREVHYKYTLPWKDDGARILPAKAFGTYQAEMRKLRAEFENAADLFCQAYPDYVEEAHARLNGMFDPKDYPAAEAIRGKFTWEVSFDPLPTGGDFRVELDAMQVQAIQDQIDAKTRDSLAEGMRDAWQRLHEALSRVVERLSKPDAIFRDSLIGNVRELCDVLPLLNVSDNPDLEAARRSVLANIATLDPETLRIDPNERLRAAGDAQRIIDDLSAFMGN